jgi:hypothetical protein
MRETAVSRLYDWTPSIPSHRLNGTERVESPSDRKEAHSRPLIFPPYEWKFLKTPPHPFFLCWEFGDPKPLLNDQCSHSKLLWFAFPHSYIGKAEELCGDFQGALGILRKSIRALSDFTFPVCSFCGVMENHCSASFGLTNSL